MNQISAIVLDAFVGGADCALEEGWLCPALLRRFETAPGQIFLQIRPKAVAAQASLGEAQYG